MRAADSTRRVTAVTAAALAVFALGACQQRSLDLESVVDLHVRARGGPEAFERVHGMRVELHLVEPTFEADLVYQAMRPHYARVDVTIAGQWVFTEALNASGAWQQAGPDQPVQATSPEGTLALRHGAVGNLVHQAPHHHAGVVHVPGDHSFQQFTAYN